MNKIVRPTRIGCPPYLNTRPLIEGLDCPPLKMVPSQLCAAFLRGDLDVALLSSIDVINYCTSAVADVSISCNGPVRSVFLAYTGELKEIKSIQLDPSSHTSNNLAKIIVNEFYGLKPQYICPQNRLSIDYPAIVIGDAALALRYHKPIPDLKFIDLGEEWRIHTNLPFVFALWAIVDGYTEKKYISDVLRKCKITGINRIDEIAATTNQAELSKSYLKSSLVYDFGEQERKGLELFCYYLSRIGIEILDPRSISYY